MSVKRRAEGSYQVVVCHGGKTLRRSSRHWTYQQAREVETRLNKQIRDAAAGIEPDRQIAEGLERFLTEHVPRLGSKRQTNNHARALLPYIAGRKLKESAAVWAEVKAGMAGKAPATVNHKGRILRQICRLALREWGWLDREVAITLLPETPREAFLSPEQVEALALACADEKAGDYVRLAAYTGIRRGHLLRLTAHDLNDGWLRLDRSSKTRTLQQLPVHPRVQAIAERLPLGISGHHLQREWTQARKVQGLEHVRWHDLRHTCASWLVQAGVPLLTVRDFLGHSTVAVTQRYAHLAPQHLKDAILKLA